MNMLKSYHVRDDDSSPVLARITVTSDTCDESENPGDDFMVDCGAFDIRLENAGILDNLESKSHLEPSQQCMYPDSNHVFRNCCCNDDILC